MEDSTNQRIGMALALSAAFLWGVSGAVAADAFADVSPARVAQARAFLAALVLVPYAWARGMLRVRSGWPSLVALGVNLAAVNVTFYWAIDRLGVGPGATIQFLGPILVLGWMVLIQGRKVSPVAWAAAVVAIVGVALVSQAWDVADADWTGVGAGLASAVFFASYLLLGEHVGRRMRAVTVVSWGFLFATAFWAVVQPVWSFPTNLAGGVWGKLLFVGIAGTAVPFLIEFAALRRAAAGLVGVVATAEPVIGAAAAWILLDQNLSTLQIVGGLMVVTAVASIQRWGLPAAEVPYEVAR
ncbi:MAG: EamA family transporter [Acidimicrobiia bacterium]|nr:EamA family transporter [Acidimicrobiia bacterium]